MLGLKGEYWGLLPNSVLSSHQPIPKAQRELFSKQSLWPLLTALRPIPGSHRDLPPCPLPPDFPPPRKASWRTGGSLLARCPLTLPCPHNGDARNAHLWVGSANTPSLNTTHAQSGTPIPHSLRFLPVSLPPSSPPPTMALSPPDTPPSPALSPPPSPPKTAAGSESSKEELVSQPLSWTILPSLGSSRPPQLSQVSGGISTTATGAWPLGPRRKCRGESSSPNPASVYTRYPGTG